MSRDVLYPRLGRDRSCRSGKDPSDARDRPGPRGSNTRYRSNRVVNDVLDPADSRDRFCRSLANGRDRSDRSLRKTEDEDRGLRTDGSSCRGSDIRDSRDRLVYDFLNTRFGCDRPRGIHADPRSSRNGFRDQITDP